MPTNPPTGSKPKKKHVFITVRDKKTGALKRVSMEASRAAALRKRREVAKTNSLIPSGFRDQVDADAITSAVASHIASLNAPLDQLSKDVQTQADTNVRMSDSLAAQTQASLDQLVANANARTSGFQQLAGQGIAALGQTNREAASATARALGGVLNPQLAQQVDANLAPAQAQQHAQGVGDVWAQTLASGAQRDFFERGKGIAAITQQSFNEGQRRQMSQSLERIAAEQRANQQKRAELVRQFAQEDYTLKTAFEQAGAEAAAAAAQAEIDAYNAETGRIDALNDGSGGSGGGGGSKANAKAVSKVQADINKMVAQMRKPTATRLDKDGKVTQVFPTPTEVFGKDNGPWREAYTRLTASNVGVSKAQAARLASQWFPGSITRSTPAKLVAMFNRLGVPTSIQKQIMRNQGGFSLEQINTALNGRTVYGPPAPPTRPNRRPAATPSRTLNMPNGEYIINRRQRTISGMTYTLRTPGGRNILVTVPPGERLEAVLRRQLAGD